MIRIVLLDTYKYRQCQYKPTKRKFILSVFILLSMLSSDPEPLIFSVGVFCQDTI